ncbi:MAG: hypothetical protein K2K45_08260 [Muribaculaceae bacterium]|nr:hypothetical protein [Muribaculaceae bacterium]
MEEKQLTEKESLELIASMIARTKTRYLGSKKMLMWGYLVVITAISVWIMRETTHNPLWNWLWFAIPIIGFPTTSLMTHKQQRYHGAISYSDKITSRLWTIFGISEIVLIIMCLGFYLFGETDCSGAILIYSILMTSGAEIAQGLIVRENSLIFGGILGLLVGMITVCCIAGKIPLYVNWYMPLFILTWVFVMIIPGHILSSKEKQK